MKYRLLLLGLIVVVTIPARAGTYTVKTVGGGNYTTIGECAAVAVAGDTCEIFAGVYNETVTPANSGLPGSPIIFMTNPGDAVTVTGWNLGSLSYLTIMGSASVPMTITQTITWSALTYSTFQYISNTTGYAASCFGGGGWYSSGQPTSYNQFLNLSLAYCGGTTNNGSGAIDLEGHYNLFDTINCSYSEACITLSGQFNVIRNSTFGPTSTDVISTNHSQPVESSVACGGGSPDIPGGLQHLLYENNYSAQWRGSNSHGIALITDTGVTACGTTTNVFRLSSTMDSGSYGTEIYSSLNSYFYNDSFSNTQQDNSPKDREDYLFDPSAPNSRTINNIFANMTQVGSEDWCIYADEPLLENHNLCFDTGYTGPWLGPTTSSSDSSYDSSDIFNKDPLFANPDTNLQLQAGSPAIAAGGPLTTAVGAGSNSTSLTVGDANLFSWGYGIPNVEPDWIRVGDSTTVEISNIDYASSLITLVSPISWSDGDGVYLFKNSSGNVVLNGGSPNIGADQSGLSFVYTGSLNPGRYDHTATLLNNGMVLIVGGYETGGGVLGSAELYSPSTGLFTATGSLNTARFDHTATLLGNGMVLIAGGYGQSSVLSSAELYDPSTGTFTPTANMSAGRVYGTATLQSTGKVLIAGGSDNGSNTILSSAELYDPSSGTFAPTGNMTMAREYYTATVLSDGTVLIAGGFSNSGGAPLTSAELYDPSSGTFTATGSMNQGRWHAAATLLQNGMVLVTGGDSSGFLTSAELYDPSREAFTTTGSMNIARIDQTATTLQNGIVLIAGGIGTGSIILTSSELYNPSTATFTTTGSLNTPRVNQSSTLLQNGTVLVTGGESTGSATLDSAEVSR